MARRLYEGPMFLSAFLREVYLPAKLELSPEWVRQLAVSIQLYSRWLGRPAGLADLDEDHLRRFLTDYRQTHKSSTTNNQRRNLCTLWETAYDEELLDRPPRRRRIPRARCRPTLPEAWTPAEVARLLETVATAPQALIAGLPAAPWWRSLILTLYDTGERRGAALAVRPEHVDLAQGSIVFHATKTGQPRWAPIHAETVDACRAIHDRRRALMWPWPASGPALEKRFRRLCRIAQIPHGTGRGGLFHKLRRTSGSLVEANGGDGARHLGNTREVFLRCYRDPRLTGRGQLELLPRPRI